jgi:predicted extracellular nuclease
MILILLVSCTQDQTATPTQTESVPVTEHLGTDHLVISEIMAGSAGNNNLDFIELYNPTQEIVNLQDYSLWYQLKKDQEDVLIYTWETSAYIPPSGHYLLLRENQDIGLEVDAYFDYSLVPQRGSLALRQRTTGIVDQVAWGNTDAIFFETVKAPAFSNGDSLERLPGGKAGNGQDTDDNAKDFIANKSPSPQTSASLSTPEIEKEMELQVNVAENTTPGSLITYEILVTNSSSEIKKSVRLYFPLLKDLVFKNSSIESTQNDDQLTFLLGDFAAGSSINLKVSFETPWKYDTITVPGIFINSEEMNSPVFSGPVRTLVQGGAVPIGIAENLLDGESVIVEGTATMYSGGFFAGTSGTKFYIEDNTGGVQVYVPGGAGKVEVPLGAYVRVQGIPQTYRGTIEIVPSPEDVSIIRQPIDPFAWDSHPLTINELLNQPENFSGELVTLSGEVSRVEEFSFSYEIDLVQDEKFITVYIDKLTEMNLELVDPGQYYQITGIVEMVDDDFQIYPRVQSDLAEIQAPGVSMIAQVPVNYDPSQDFTINVNVNNHLPDSINNLDLSLAIPNGLSVKQVSDNGIVENGQVSWTYDALSGNGSEKIFSLSGTISANVEYLFLENYRLIIEDHEKIITGDPVYSFPGDSVPVWAVQGTKSRSPYLLQPIRTNGVVTAVFPEMEGFFIQGDPDQNPDTSQGLFVFQQVIDSTIQPGDLITIQGTIHEPHTETQLFLEEWQITASNQPLPAAIKLNPPADETASANYYEALEGMLVSVNGPVKAVSPTNKYGETAVVLPLYTGDHLMQGEQTGMAIRVDDGSFITHTDQSSMLYAAITGDTLYDISGPLTFNFGYFKIEPLSAPRVEHQSQMMGALPPTTSEEFRVMTWNVENLFDFLEPHPSDPALPTVAEYRVWLEKVASTILLARSPAVVGLQEVENIGVLEDIAEMQGLSEFGYQAVLMEGTDSRGIDVGFLVRGDVQIMNVQQFPAPNELTPRPPLLLEVQINTGAETKTVFLLNNHFLSMSGGEKATEPRRIAQADWNAVQINKILKQKPDAFVIVMGDLNSYYDSPPIDTLRSAGMIHIFDQLPANERYTYIYQGVAQVLDHIMVNKNYQDSISSVDILHVNADYPLQLPGDTSVLHKSDHDPVVVTFR